jgi:hypothetical protein
MRIFATAMIIERGHGASDPTKVQLWRPTAMRHNAGSAALTVRRIWTFLSPYQSHHSDDGRDDAAKQHPYCLVGR